MRVLVTGGTGVVGRSTVTALLQRGHAVSLFSRHAGRDAAQWAHGVAPIAGDVADRSSIQGAADGCDVVLHMTGIMDEHGANTFERVNVEGARNVVGEAQRAGVQRLVYVSSLGADRGESAYHRSKRKGEAIVRQFNAAWTIVRIANVYGPGDEQISLLLRMVRSLPVLPVVGDGDQPFQPIWHDDVAEVLARAAEREDLAGRELDVAGSDITSQTDLIQRFARLTGRHAPRVAVPDFLARVGVTLASAVGVDVPLNASQLQMLSEGNVIAAGRENATMTVFDVTPTPLDRGLEQLVNIQDEQMPDSGVGPLKRRRYWADINASAKTPESLTDDVCEHFADLMAGFIDTQPEPVARTTIEQGQTITLSLPLRGHVQVRVAEREARVFTLVTLQGHPLAGAVRFLSEARGDELRFEVQVYDRAASVIDFVAMRAFGDRLQDAAWRELVQNVVARTGGAAPAGVQQENETLDEKQAGRIEDWLRGLVLELKHEEAGI
ncbi:MAG TPA: complex I NDUFA9 subunit family protein [Gemmatimonadaceae bacterium]|nr:complex I NDUFA9 subunit family protein [Gemmatimonadaceae bacterium]